MRSKSKEKLCEKWREKRATAFGNESSGSVEYNGDVYTSGEIRFLRYVKENPNKTSIQLAAESGKTRGTVSLIMKKLTEKNLAVFQDDKNHRKRKNIVITPLGYEICKIRDDNDLQFINGVISELENKYSTEEMDIALSAIYDILSSH